MGIWANMFLLILSGNYTVGNKRFNADPANAQKHLYPRMQRNRPLRTKYYMDTNSSQYNEEKQRQAIVIGTTTNKIVMANPT